MCVVSGLCVCVFEFVFLCCGGGGGGRGGELYQTTAIFQPALIRL